MGLAFDKGLLNTKPDNNGYLTLRGGYKILKRGVVVGGSGEDPGNS